MKRAGERVEVTVFEENKTTNKKRSRISNKKLRTVKTHHTMINSKKVW